MSGINVICADCGTTYEMGNGHLATAEKPGHVHHFGNCPKCGRKTWSKAFKLRPMTPEEILKALEK